MSGTLAQGLSRVRAELASGAVVLLQETSMTPAVTINASFRAGSMFDPIDLPGLAYLTGRLIDRGTIQRTAAVLADELDDRGVSLRVSSNRTALTVSCTCLTEDFDEILAIIADVVRNPVFPESEVGKRRSEALTILRQNEDNPSSRAVEGVLELLYSEHHPYGRPSKGIPRGVERILRADMVAFHHRRIRPGALTLAIVGDVEPARALDRATAAFDGWVTEPPAPLDLLPPDPAASRRERFIPMPGKSQTDIAYAFTTVRRLDPRYDAYWLMNHVLGQFGLGGRLADNIRERQGMAYYAYSTLDPAPVEAPLLIRAGVDPANVERTVAAIDHEVATLAASGPTATELEESRAYLIGSIPRLLETNQSIAAFLQTCEDYGLGLDFDQRLPALLSAVTLDQVRGAAVEALDPARASIAIAGPGA
jgi:zinc protease